MHTADLKRTKHKRHKMKLMKFAVLLVAGSLGLRAFDLSAQEKIDLQEPKQPELLQELKDDPDGVLSYKTNEDGSFRSLLVKATVEIEDVLGAQKGKRLARQEAEIQCKRDLAKWLDENCSFVEGSNHTLTIQTKGQSARDAAGNVVRLRNQESQESQLDTDSHTSFSQRALKGLTVISSEISPDGQEFTLVMALTQKSLNQTATVAKALSGSRPIAETGGSEADRPNPESKINRDALNDLR
jgi:hypothetical protein